jgi:hypothetical protein
MAGHILLLFYGLCAWGAALNLPAWIRLAVRAWRAPDRRPPWKNDTHMLVRFGIMALAFGTSGLAGLRTIASLTGRVPLEVPSKAGLLPACGRGARPRARYALAGMAALLGRRCDLVRDDLHRVDLRLMPPDPLPNPWDEPAPMWPEEERCEPVHGPVVGGSGLWPLFPHACSRYAR